MILTNNNLTVKKKKNTKLMGYLKLSTPFNRTGVYHNLYSA